MEECGPRSQPSDSHPVLLSSYKTVSRSSQLLKNKLSKDSTWLLRLHFKCPFHIPIISWGGRRLRESCGIVLCYFSVNTPRQFPESQRRTLEHNGPHIAGCLERHPKHECTFVPIILRKGTVNKESSMFRMSNVVRTHQGGLIGIGRKKLLRRSWNFALFILNDVWWRHLRSLGIVIFWNQRGWEIWVHFQFFCYSSSSSEPRKEVPRIHVVSFCFWTFLLKLIEKNVQVRVPQSDRFLHFAGCLRKVHLMCIVTSCPTPSITQACKAYFDLNQVWKFPDK